MKLPSSFRNLLDITQRGRVSGIEDRIEQKYKLFDVIQSLNVINTIAGPNDVPLTDKQKANISEFGKLIAEIDEELRYSPKTQVQLDRDAIHEVAARNGMAATLMFLNSSLLNNIERFFSGVVLLYIGIFDSDSKRSAINHKLVFQNDADLHAVHMNFYSLRNEWYAHSGRDDGRHELHFTVSGDEEIEIDVGSPQVTPEYHLSEFQNLYRCTVKALSFVEDDIEKKSVKFISSLTDEQRGLLLELHKKRPLR